MTGSPSTEWRPCPVCRHGDAAPLLGLNGFQLELDRPPAPRRIDIRQVQCRRCFCAYMNPVYAADGLFADAGASFVAQPHRVAEQAAWLERRGLGSVVLDVGCYEGRLLEALPRHLRKLGVEVDGPAADRARVRLAGHDAEIVHGDLASLAPGAAPDTVLLFHVLEHLPDPVAALSAVRALAAAGTRLVVEVPIVERGETNDLVGFFSVQHTTHFSRQSLDNCLRAAGWEPAETWEDELDYNGRRVLAVPAPPADPLGDPADAATAARVIAAWDRAAEDVSRRVAAVGSRCVVWGAGQHLEYLFHRTPLFAGREVTVVDSDPHKQGGRWRGHAIAPPEALEPGVPLVVSSYGSQEEIAAAAVALGARPDDVVRLYDRVSAY